MSEKKDAKHDRLTREATFWNKYVHAPRKWFRRNWYGRVNRYMWKRTLARLGDLQDRRILFVGCGESTSIARTLAERGGEVWCLDISEESIARLRECDFGALERKIHAVLGDAENMPFDEGAFDVVVGKAIVHHLDIDALMRELRRVCVANAKIVFCEPLGTNPLINLFRWLTPGLRVPDEHPLVRRDIGRIRSDCSSFSMDCMEFLTVISFPLFVLGLGRVASGVYAVARALERLLFGLLPPTRWLAWSLVFEGRLREKTGGTADGEQLIRRKTKRATAAGA